MQVEQVGAKLLQYIKNRNNVEITWDHKEVFFIKLYDKWKYDISWYHHLNDIISLLIWYYNMILDNRIWETKIFNVACINLDMVHRRMVIIVIIIIIMK